MNHLAVLVVSVFPRGEPFGEPALVALDPDSFDVLAYREFPPSEFLENPASGRPGSIRHARGLARRGSRLFVSLFNAVGEYWVADPAGLDLSLKRRLTAPEAADLHGISSYDGSLAAASTGGDCVLIWDLGSGASRSIGLARAAPPAIDIRFPGQADEPVASWREALPGRGHLNDVALTGGGFVSCSLNRIVVSSRDGERVVAECSGALFHDAQPVGEGELFATDGARGEVVFIDLSSLRARRVAVSDPDRWFVRGAAIAGDHAYILRSQVTENRQTLIGANGRPQSRRATLGVSVLELGSRQLVAEAEVALVDAPKGSVAYQPLLWPVRT